MSPFGKTYDVLGSGKSQTVFACMLDLPQQNIEKLYSPG